MNYTGKLYGHLGDKRYFDTGKTSEDWDNLEAENERLKTAISLLADDYYRRMISADELLEKPNNGSVNDNIRHGRLSGKRNTYKEILADLKNIIDGSI